MRNILPARATWAIAAVELMRTALWRKAVADASGMTGTTTVQRRVLALLLIAYIFNFLDRQILGILAEPMIADPVMAPTSRPTISAP